MTYKTSLDNLAKLVTISITILFAFIIIEQFSVIRNTGKVIPIFTTSTLILIYFGTFVFRPINYVLTADKLIVHRFFKNVQIDRTQIVSAKILDNENIKGSIRTFGVGGLFGYFGKFAKYGLGSMTWYATRRDNMVLILTEDNQKIVLSPDEPELFIANFNV